MSRREAHPGKRDDELELGSAAEQWRQSMRPKRNIQKAATARVRVNRRAVRLAALTGEQFGRLLQHRLIRTEPYRTMVLVAACTGLTASELSVLRWRDVDRKNGKLYVRKPTSWGISTGVTISLSPRLADVLNKWKRQSHFKRPDDLVFARRGGKIPFDFSRAQKDRLEQAGIDIGFGKLSDKSVQPLGWDSFRRSYAAWLIATGASSPVLMRLLRLVTPPRPTDDMAAESPAREANSKVVDLLQR